MLLYKGNCIREKIKKPNSTHWNSQKNCGFAWHFAE